MAMDAADSRNRAAHSIPRERETTVSENWQRELRDAYRDPRALLAALDLAYAARMRRGDASDPLLRQVLPLAAERRAQAGYGEDPLGEFARLGGDSLLQKYAGRALLIVTAACAIHCRYCFRRSFPYQASAGRTRLARALGRIASDTSLHEVILSGGDPLTLDDAALAPLLARLAAIPHVRRVRLHSRLPIVLPSRLGPGLCTLLAGQRYQTVLVVHANHPRELDAATIAALARARAAGLILLNQAVLLGGVNDDVHVLAELSEALFAAGVLPYYLHLLDRVAGTAHFDVPTARARELEHALRQRLPGYLVPRVVREIDGAGSKLPLSELPPD
jgi:L-lysine 2,3-aminomutase